MADYFEKSVSAVMPDGKVRQVRARAHRYDGSLAPDTYFSVPARVTVQGKNVKGYISCDWNNTPDTRMRFNVMNSHKHLIRA